MFVLLLRYKQKVADSELACEQAHQYLVIKAKTRWADLSKVRKGREPSGAEKVRQRQVPTVLVPAVLHRLSTALGMTLSLTKTPSVTAVMMKLFEYFYCC